MLNLLSIITFLPAAAALIGAVFLHGEDETAQVQPVIAAEFAQVVRSGRSHELDAGRGLFLQRLLQHAAPPSGARD